MMAGWLRIRFIAPLAIFILLTVFFAIGLTRDPRKVPSPLIGKPVPEFELPPVQGRSQGLAANHLRGEVSIVNVFASWCAPCREEHPHLVSLARQGVVTIHGLNYKDAPEAASKWLDTLGDPYRRTGADLDGRVGIDWGVYGVPETFVIDRDGRVAYKHVGPLTPQIIEKELRPLLRQLQTRAGP